MPKWMLKYIQGVFIWRFFRVSVSIFLFFFSSLSPSSSLSFLPLPMVDTFLSFSFFLLLFFSILTFLFVVFHSFFFLFFSFLPILLYLSLSFCKLFSFDSEVDIYGFVSVNVLANWTEGRKGRVWCRFFYFLAPFLAIAKINIWSISVSIHHWFGGVFVAVVGAVVVVDDRFRIQCPEFPAYSFN